LSIQYYKLSNTRDNPRYPCMGYGTGCGRVAGGPPVPVPVHTHTRTHPHGFTRPVTILVPAFPNSQQSHHPVVAVPSVCSTHTHTLSPPPPSKTHKRSRCERTRCRANPNWDLALHKLGQFSIGPPITGITDISLVARVLGVSSPPWDTSMSPILYAAVRCSERDTASGAYQLWH
jgi:hypothetical protein